MRFRAEIRNISTFTKFTASLSTLGHIAWVRLNNSDVRFTVIPEQGTQVWSVLALDTIFTDYTCQSAAEDNTINLEVPLHVLHRALKSAQNAIGANIRLTKKDGVPLLSLTIKTETLSSQPVALPPGHDGFAVDPTEQDDSHTFGHATSNGNGTNGQTSSFREQSTEFFDASRDRETVVTQDIPIRVLAPASVEGLHEPRCREPDVHIVLPNLVQLKSISDRFTRLALSTSKSWGGGSGFASESSRPKLELSANMHGCLRLSLATDPLSISSLWTGLENPELDPEQCSDGLENHPSTLMKQKGEDAWATVRVEGKDWGRVLSVGRLGGRVIACFCHEHAVVLYVFLGDAEGGEGESVLTYYISSYTA